MSESTNMNSALTFEATERKGANRGVEFKLSPKSCRACELACKVALMHEAARDSSLVGRSWDPDLAKTAKAWAKKCLFEHNTYLKDPGQAHPKFTPVGENLWTGTVSIFTVQGAIATWYNEVSDYNYATNNCRKTCGHYTQIVWATSYKVGCAVHFCPTVAYSHVTNAAHFICNYGPAGNYPRHPYKTGAACSDCNGNRCAGRLCQNAERDKVISDSKWHPDWDRPACDEYCITVIALRPLLLILTILATWLLPKYCSIAPTSE
ncbi:glioma pathogenesis-related protein 1 isoform X2 [Chroicocephalus ridibundus]|uniref:glioma pathogenesis-related protein 1 isoform X2 n=1 Tax=Chroicocephalus ridibundus TaxID=1192867 RepID=UPI002FDD4C0C